MRLRLLVALCILAALALAGGRPLIRYRGGSEGTVVFDHQLHASQGARCADCHTDFAGTGRILFTTRKKALISFADHGSDRLCFACHNGKETRRPFDYPVKAQSGAFRQAFDECGQCHRNLAQQ